MSDMPDAPITLGGVEITTAKAKPSRMSMLLWGDAGCGKTVLACTSPGKKLLVNFDPDGPASVADRDDVFVLDLSAQSASVVDKLKADDPVKLGAYLDDNPDIETVIVDSITSLSELCLASAVSHYAGRNSSMEEPGMHGYTRRNVLMRRCINGFIKQTGIRKKHIILIAHEDAPTTNKEGIVMYISTTLGPKLSTRTPGQLSEVWCLYDTGKERRIAIRPVRLRKPMKTRMFTTADDAEFVWKYDPEKDVGMKICDWWDEWNTTRKKLPLPVAKKR